MKKRRENRRERRSEKRKGKVEEEINKMRKIERNRR